MSEEQEPTVEHLESAQRMYLSEIMDQLCQSDRFKRFFEANYEVQTHLDEVNKCFNIVLIERPPELALKRLQEMLQKAGVDNTPVITLATSFELDLIKKDFNIQ